MSTTYVQAAQPIWYVAGLDGLAAGGAQLFTYDSLTRTPRAAYQDPAGNEPYPNPIIFNLNGTNPPIYWQVDTTKPNGYYIEMYDSNGNLLWDEDNFPGSGSGGGSDVTTYIPIVNYITNNQFINHIAPTTTALTTNFVVAPSNHKGFTPSLINPIISTYGVVGPDIQFNKSNTSSTDQISFPLFALSADPLIGDVTPVDYVRYQCTVAGTETYKNFQFPITQKVKNLSGQAMTFNIWAAVTSTPVTINIYIRQYFGSGTSASADSRILIGSCVLSSTWTSFPFQFTVPSVAGKSIGTPGLQTDDDAVYIQVEMPLGTLCDVLFTKPCLYLGTIDPKLEFESYDQIDSIDSTARTGDIKTSLISSSPQGWVAMNDGTIGNTGSGATLAAGAYTFQLYKTIWDGVLDAWAPVSTGRGATAQADFLAGKTLKLPLSLGRALAGAGAGSGLTPYVLGQNTGAETSNALVNHTHTVGIPTASSVGGSSAAISGPFILGAATTLTTSTAGTGSSFSLLQPTSFFNVFIKL